MKNLKTTLIIVMVLSFTVIRCKRPRTPIPEPKPIPAYGIYSETIGGGNLDKNIKILTDCNGDPPCYHFFPDSTKGFLDDYDDYFEGDRSKKTTINVRDNEWFVWFVEKQKNDKPHIIDMSVYEGGNLKFAIKANENIPDLVVGIRSENIEPGNEIKIRISKYLGSGWNDSSWQEVSIPIDDFSTANPDLDFKLIQALFAVGSSRQESGPTNGPGTFWIDNIRWTAKESD